MEQTAKIYFEQGPVIEFECFRDELIKKGVVILGNRIIWNEENKAHLNGGFNEISVCCCGYCTDY